jgi:RNA polymerase sigma factor (sigma-70 family)
VVEPAFMASAYSIAYPLARAKAARWIALGAFRFSDREDIIADLLLHFLQKLKLFDPRRASLRTFASRVMDSYAISLARRARARQRLTSGDCRSLQDAVIGPDGGSAELWATIPDPTSDMAVVREFETSLDISHVLVTLPRSTRTVATLLSELTPAQAGRLLGRSRAWVYNHIARMRSAFISAGLAPAGLRRRHSDRNLRPVPISDPKGRGFGRSGHAAKAHVELSERRCA